MNLLANLRDLASTSIALLRVAGAVHRQARATERQEKHLATIGAQLGELIKVQESRLRLELLRQGADDEALAEEWNRVKNPPVTLGDQAQADGSQGSLLPDTPGQILEALESVLPGSLEEKELIALIQRGGSSAEFADLLAQHGLPGGAFTGALSQKSAREIDKELDKEERDQEKLIEAAALELRKRALGDMPSVTPRDKGEVLGGASFGGVDE